MPVLSKKNFDTRTFLTHRRVHLRNDSVLRQTILTENRDTRPPSLIPNIFRYQFSETQQKGSSTKFFGTETKNFERSLLHIKIIGGLDFCRKPSKTRV